MKAKVVAVTLTVEPVPFVMADCPLFICVPLLPTVKLVVLSPSTLRM